MTQFAYDFCGHAVYCGDEGVPLSCPTCSEELDYCISKARRLYEKYPQVFGDPDGHHTTAYVETPETRAALSEMRVLTQRAAEIRAAWGWDRRDGELV